MSVTIKLYNNASDTNVLSKYITQIGSDIIGVFKETTSILNPTVKIDGSLPTNCNYFYIAEFNRYYYIDDVKTITADIFEITGHVDVLKTYESQIRGCTGIVARQENDWNLYLDDGSFKTYNNPLFQMLVFDSGFDDLHFILAVAGSDSSSS